MELLEGKSYTLNIDAKEFAEKTWRNALAELIKNNGYITIDRIAIGDTGTLLMFCKMISNMRSLAISGNTSNCMICQKKNRRLLLKKKSPRLF